MTASGIPKHCNICGAELLNPRGLTGLCLECKLVLRNERLADNGEAKPETLRGGE